MKIVLGLIIIAVIVYWVYKSRQTAAMAERAKAVIEARKELFEEKNFLPVREFALNSCMKAWFDNESECVAISTPDDHIVFIDYGTILGHELMENGRSSFSGSIDSALTGAVVGKALFDNAMAGAVVGAAGTSFDSEKICSSMIFALKLDDMDVPYMEIPLLEREVDCESDEYANLRGKAGELSALFDIVEHRKGERKLSGGKVVSYKVSSI